MFSLLARSLRILSQKAKWIIGFAILISLICIYPVSNLKWELQLADMLNTNTLKEYNHKFEGLLPLSVVIESPDSLANFELAKQIASKIETSPLVRFSLYHIDFDFYKQNKLLYLSTKDFNLFYQNILDFKDFLILQNNPFYIALDSAPENTDTTLLSLDKKYSIFKKDFFQNKNGTIRILDIFPNNNTENLDSARAFVSFIKKNINTIKTDRQIKISYGGKIIKVVSTGKALLPEAKKAGVTTTICIAILLLLLFVKHPQLILPTGIPIALSIYWTLGAAYFLYGRICLFSLLLALILPGLAASHITHLFTRYLEERKKGLRPNLSLESALLGIGPVVAVTSITTAIIFLSLWFIPFQGLQELGVLGAIGAILNWILCSTLTPAILRILQKNKSFRLFEKIHPDSLTTEELKPFKHTTKLLILLFLFTFLLAIHGLRPNFHYDFSETEMANKTRADIILAETGHNFNDPVLVYIPNETEQAIFLERFIDGKQSGFYQHIAQIYSLQNILPKNQEYKLHLISNLKKDFNEIPNTPSEVLDSLKNLFPVSKITEESLPENLKQIFDSRQDLSNFLIILPEKSSNDGLACRRLMKELNILQGEFEYSYIGIPVIYANVLNSILPHLLKFTLLALAAIIFMLLLFYNKLSYTVFTIAEPCIAFVWLFSSLNIFNIQLSVYSALALPILIGMSLDGSLHFWNHYFSKQKGNAWQILKRYGLSIGIAQIMTLVGMFSLIQSSHPGLKSIGQISILGICCIILSNFLFFPLFAAMLDKYRLKKAKKQGQL